MQEVEYCTGNLGKDKYEASLWQDHDLRPWLDDQIFEVGRDQVLA